jgi:hypothetical protein
VALYPAKRARIIDILRGENPHGQSHSPVIFSGDSLFGPIIDTTTGMSLIASDNPGIASSFPIASGATVGLGHVSYSIGNTATAGPFAIT